MDDVSRYHRYLGWLSEAAGIAGLIAALAACSLAVSGPLGAAFWAAAAIAFAGNVLSIAQVITQRATGQTRLGWRELILANIVPATPLAMTVVLAGEGAGWFRLPGLGAVAPKPHVITISPHIGGNAGTH